MDSLNFRGTLEGHSGWVTAIATTENPNVLISASRDKSIIVWDLKRDEINYGVPRRSLTGHNHFISDVAISSDGQFALSASWDKTLRLWDLNTGNTTRQFIGHTNDVLRKAALRTFGCNGVLRVRCSDGILVDQHLGNFFMRNSSDVELACVDSEKTVTVILQHEGGKLDEKLDISFQVALLYTRSDGERRIRIHNLSVPVTTLAGNLFKYADVDCLLNVMGKMAVSAALESNLKSVRERLTERCVRILTAYRQNCAQGTSPGQLILPENLKLLPVLTNSLLKNQALRSGMDVSLDLRVQQMKNWRSLPVTQTIPLLYPRLASLHTMTPDVGKPDAFGRIILPKFTRLSYPFMEPEGAYLLENGHTMQLWLGRKVDPNLLSAVFGVNSLEQVDSNMTELPNIDNPFAEQVRQIVHELRRQRPHGMPLSVIRQQLDPTEVALANLLVEDKNLDNPSYIDYLCLVHRQIQIEINRS